MREPAAAVLRLPHGRGVPVQFRAERGQQSLEGDVGVRCLGERSGDPEGGVEVPGHLELSLEPQ